MNRRIFTGTDPGTKGACAVIAVADCPGDESAHGRVLAVEVFDLPVVARDNGGHELDVVTFKVALRTALVNVCGDLGGATGCDGLVEYPVLIAGFGGGVRSKVQQGVNAGAVWAAMKATGLVQVAWVDSDKWRGELASGTITAPAKGDEISRACDALMGVPNDDSMLLSSTDRAVAVLLADVARRRWLGTAVAPRTTGTARAAKARKADRRKAAIARAVAPLTVAKARDAAMFGTQCQVHLMDAGYRCQPRNGCCEARLLNWAWRQRPDLPIFSDPSAAQVDAIPAIKSITGPGWHMFRRTARSKDWTVETNETVGPIPGEVGDVLIDHGLVALTTGTKDVVYARTPRGVEWALRLEKVSAAQVEAATKEAKP